MYSKCAAGPQYVETLVHIFSFPCAQFSVVPFQYPKIVELNSAVFQACALVSFIEKEGFVFGLCPRLARNHTADLLIFAGLGK